MALVRALEELEHRWGPKAYRAAIRGRETEGRPRERSDKIIFSVWLLVELVARGLKVPVTKACDALGKYAEIDEMTQSVGFFNARAPGKRWTSGKNKGTWRRLHAEGSSRFAQDPGQRAIWKEALDEAAPRFENTDLGTFLRKEIEKRRPG